MYCLCDAAALKTSSARPAHVVREVEEECVLPESLGSVDRYSLMCVCVVLVLSVVVVVVALGRHKSCVLPCVFVCVFYGGVGQRVEEKAKC